MPERENTRALWACLFALVLLNLVFVHISRGVGLHWLVPLYALTVVSPWLLRMRENMLYRAVWNIGVIAIFGLLVRDAAGLGVHLLLEDGLILAAFCQVHLLNNLGQRQKPDLLFFNSFLIALVTSFFCQDVVYAVTFGVYAVVLTVSLQLSCARAHGWPRGLLRDGSIRAVVALGATMAVFLCWPRDFNRVGLVGETLRHSSVMEVGFSEEVELGQSATTVATGRVVMRVRLLRGAARDVPTHWRGATFSWFNQGRWDQPRDREQAMFSSPWVPTRGNRWLRPGHETRTSVSVEVAERQLSRLFAPLESHQLDVSSRWERLVILPCADGTLRCSLTFSDDAGMNYELALHEPDARRGDAPRPEHWPDTLPHPDVAASDLPPNGRDLAERIAQRHRGQPQHVVVEAMRHHLSDQLAYLLPGRQGAARDLEEFLSGTAGGHCEYFATALALMLRSQGIPSRLVTGYAANEWDEAERVLTVRAKHAHAWVEVFDPSGYWYAVDPSPTASGDDTEAAQSWFDEILAAGGALWDSIAAFDGQRRDAALAWLLAAPGNLASWLHSRPLLTTTLALLLVALLVLRRRYRRGLEPAVVRAYLGAVRRTGLRPKTGETPRELLRRARAEGVRERALVRLEEATRAHERERYALAATSGT